MTTTTTTASAPPAEVWLRYSPGWRTLAVSDGWREHTGLPAVFAVRGPVLGYVHPSDSEVIKRAVAGLPVVVRLGFDRDPERCVSVAVRCWRSTDGYVMTLRRVGGPSLELAATAELPRLGFPVPAASPEERERLAEVLS